MTAHRPGSRWRLVLGTLVFALWAPSLVGLPFAALTLATRPRSAAVRVTALVVGAVSFAVLLLPPAGLLEGFVSAYVVLLTAAFVGLVLLAPTRGFLSLSAAASLVAATAAAALARLVVGGPVFPALSWAATRDASATVRLMVERWPALYTMFEPVVRFVSETVPATLALQSFAGLALAWQWHHRVAERPLGAPLAPFREFRFSDHSVWGVVAALLVWITPALAGLKVAAANVLMVLGALYLLRGSAIVLSFAAAWSVAPLTWIAGALVAATFAVPLLALVAALGVTDTWIEFRRRLKAPA